MKYILFFLVLFLSAGIADAQLRDASGNQINNPVWGSQVAPAASGNTIYAPTNNAYSNNISSGSRPSRVDSLDDIFAFIAYYIGVILPLIVAFAVLVIVFNVFKYFILKGDSAEAHKQGATYIMFAVIALAAMLSLWGLVRIVQSTFGLEGFRFVPQIQSRDVR